MVVSTYHSNILIVLWNTIILTFYPRVSLCSGAFFTSLSNLRVVLFGIFEPSDPFRRTSNSPNHLFQPNSHQHAIMSLVQRVTSIEGTDRAAPPPQLDSLFNNNINYANYIETGYGTLHPTYSLHHQHSRQHSLRRMISYDVLPNPDQPSQATYPSGAVTAYKVSSVRRLTQVVFTVLACWLSSGIVFGFAALKPVLIDQGLYRELCTRDELDANVEVCYKQDLRSVIDSLCSPHDAAVDLRTG